MFSLATPTCFTTDNPNLDKWTQVDNIITEPANVSTSVNETEVNRSHFILLTEHIDHKINDLLINSIDWIKSNFDTMLCESIPGNHEDYSAVKYLKDNVLDNEDKDFETSLPLFQLDDADLKLITRKPYATEDKNILFEKKLRILEEILEEHSIDRVAYHANAYKSVKLFELAVGKGLKIQGCEPKDGARFFGIEGEKKEDAELRVRDAEFWKNLKKCHNEGKRVIANFGAHHGIALINNIKKNNDIKVTVIRLRIKSNDVHDNFTKWKNSHKADILSTPNLNFASITIPDVFSINVQNKGNFSTQIIRSKILNRF